MTELKISEFSNYGDIPKEILDYDGKTKQMSVGKPGKVGLIQIVLEKNSINKKTVVTDQFSTVPLYIQKAIYCEEKLPEMAFLYFMSPSGGILQGDRNKIDILLKNNAISHITTQGATRVYGMNSNYSTQQVNITVGDGCYLEFIPDQIIPYANSRFYHELNLNIHDDATMIYSEILVPGRIEMKELFQYDICYLRTTIKNQDNALRCLDVAKIEPKNMNQNVLGLFGENRVLGTIYILTKTEFVRDLHDKVNSSLEKFNKVSGGATILPNQTGVMMRILGDNSDEIKAVIYETVKILRQNILNVGFSEIRKS